MTAACEHCGKPLGDNTITDQRGVWHEPCYVEANQPGYERASDLKLPIEWAAGRGYVITDPDGWRGATGRPFDEPVDEAEFVRRSSSCTLAPLSSLAGWFLFEGALERSGLDQEKVSDLLDLARSAATP